MFGFIKKLFSGITAFFTGFFSSSKSQDNQSQAPKAKKGSGYYMQLDDGEESKSKAASQQAKSNTSAEAKKPEPVKTQPATEQKKPEPVKAESAKATAQPAASKSDNGKAPEPATKPEGVRVELVQQADTLKAVPKEAAASNNGKAQPQPTTTFAPNYLIQTSSSKSRRRPGPSLDTFRDMARQVNTSS